MLESIFLIMLWRKHLIYFVVIVAKLWNDYVSYHWRKPSSKTQDQQNT